MLDPDPESRNPDPKRRSYSPATDFSSLKSASLSIITLQLSNLCSDFSEWREHNSEGHEGGDWHSRGETGAALRHHQQHRLQTAGESASIIGIAEQNRAGKDEKEVKGTLEEMLVDAHTLNKGLEIGFNFPLTPSQCKNHLPVGRGEMQKFCALFTEHMRKYMQNRSPVTESMWKSVTVHFD